MRSVTLVTEATYPLVNGGVSTWCDHLIRGLPDIDFDVLALGATGREPITWELPDNVRHLRVHGVWPEPGVHVPRAGARQVAQAEEILHQLWPAVLGPDDKATLAAFRRSLLDLVELSDTVEARSLFAATGSARALLAAWRERSRFEEWPALSVAQAVRAAAVVDHTLALVDVRPEPADLLHATANGPCTLIGMTNRWRTGRPVVMTEHGIYLREQYISLRASGLPWQMRRILTSLTRRVSQLGFVESSLILPVNVFNRTWELELGAEDSRIWPIYNGVSEWKYAPLETEPSRPTIGFVGRIDPLKDLATLLRAHALVVKDMPEAQLRIFGPVSPGNEAYAAELRELADSLGIAGSVHWEGPVSNSRQGFAAANVVALSSISEGLPYSLIEAMMCGRATVSTDVGGVAECLDAKRTSGLLVLPRNPEAMAAACLKLLRDPAARAAMGRAAAARARDHFTIGQFTTSYRMAYSTVAPDPAPAPQSPATSASAPSPVSVPSPPAPQRPGPGRTVQATGTGPIPWIPVPASAERVGSPAREPGIRSAVPAGMPPEAPAPQKPRPEPVRFRPDPPAQLHGPGQLPSQGAKVSGPPGPGTAAKPARPGPTPVSPGPGAPGRAPRPRLRPDRPVAIG